MTELPAITLADARPLLEKVEAMERRVATLEAKLDSFSGSTMSEADAAKYLSITKRKLAELRKAETVPFAWYGGRATYRRADLNAFIERETIRPRRLRAAG
jgi:hypothetical protein